MQLQNVSLKDQPLFDRYFKNHPEELSKYSFASLFLDQALFKVLWMEYKGSLCVFARQKNSCYMLLPPLGKFNPETIQHCFRIMDKYNKVSEISRIENIPANKKAIFENYGLTVKEGFYEYIYRTKDLIELKGDNFKSKRASVNRFLKNYNFKVDKFKPAYKDECLRLYKIWSGQRKSLNHDSIFQAMLDENFGLQKLAFDNFKELGLEGLVIKVDSKFSAYSFGYKLNSQSFCVLTEIADLSRKGIAQYIFKRMSELNKGAFINAMDDSGIESLRRTKLSYRPVKQVQAYVAYRN